MTGFGGGFAVKERVKSSVMPRFDLGAWKDSAVD